MFCRLRVSTVIDEQQLAAGAPGGEYFAVDLSYPGEPGCRRKNNDAGVFFARQTEKILKDEFIVNLIFGSADQYEMSLYLLARQIVFSPWETANFTTAIALQFEFINNDFVLPVR